MTFRDDHEALRAQIDQLKQQQRDLKQETRELKQENQRLKRAERRPTWSQRLGLSNVQTLERVVEGELTTQAHEELAELLRARFPGEGAIQIIGTSFSYRLAPPASRRRMEIVVSAAEGRTKILAIEQKPPFLYLLLAVVGGLGVAMVGVARVRANWTTLASVVVVSLVVAIAYLFKRRENELGPLVERIEQLVIKRARRPRVRVENPLAKDGLALNLDSVAREFDADQFTKERRTRP